jgi:N-acetylmuramoyl-L-alanine amidase
MGKFNGLAKKVLIGSLIILNSHFVVAPENYVGKNKNQFKTVVLDPGHCKDFPGKRNDLNERHYNLQVALELKKKLVQEGYNVFLTRKDDGAANKRLRNNGDLNNDGKVNLKDDILARNNFSKYYNADIFLSLHFDYNSKDTTSKTQIVFYGIPNKKNLRDRKKNFTKLSDINYFNCESANFARDLGIIYRRKGIITENYGADFGVLFYNQADKAVLIELDNLANSRIKQKVKTKEGIEKYANNLFEALISYEGINEN